MLIIKGVMGYLKLFLLIILVLGLLNHPWIRPIAGSDIETVLLRLYPIALALAAIILALQMKIWWAWLIAAVLAVAAGIININIGAPIASALSSGGVGSSEPLATGALSAVEGISTLVRPIQNFLTLIGPIVVFVMYISNLNKNRSSG